MRLAQKAAEHPVSVLMVYAALLTFGLVSFRQLDQELLPVFDLPEARVITEYQGLPAPEIEALITVPVENALSSVRNVRAINSVSMDELSSVRIEFDWGVDPKETAVQIRERVDALYPFLPHGCAKPLVFAAQPCSDRPLLTLALVPAAGKTLRYISETVRGELSSKLKQVPGVAGLRIVGLSRPEIKIDVDGAKLAAGGIALQQIARTVHSSIFRAPLGSVVEGPREYTVEATTDVESLEAIRSVPIVGHGAVPIGEFARVYWDSKLPTSFFHHNGEEAIGVFIEKTPGSGSLNTARSLRKTLDALKPVFAADLDIRIIDDPAEEIERGIRHLLLAIALGGLAVCAVLLSIFRRVGVSLIVASSIPASMMLVFLFMRFAGIGLNLISLSGIAIGIGMIVDNSIVVVDSLLRRAAHGSPEIAAASGRTMTALVGSTATTLLVFLPVVFIPGVIGLLFRDLALTVSCLLIASLLCSLTLTPALYSLMQNRPVRDERALPRHRGRGMGRVVLIYARCLARELDRPVIAPVLVAVLVLAGLLSAWILPRRLLPVCDLRTVDVRIEYPSTSPIGIVNAESREVAVALLSSGLFESVFASAGYDDASLPDRSDPEMDPRRVHFRMAVNPGASRAAASTEARIARILDGFPGIRYSIERPRDSFRRLLGDSEVVEYRLSGTDREILVSTAESIVGRLEEDRLIRAAWIDTQREAARIELSLKPDKLASQNAEPRVILDSLRTAVRGQVAAQLPVDGSRIDVRVRLDPGATAGGFRLEKINVPVAGELIEAGLFGTFERRRSYPRLYRFDRDAAVSLTVHPIAGGKQRVVSFLTEEYPDQGEVLAVSALRRSQERIFVVFAFALLLMYLVIGAQFESLILPLLLLVSLLPAVSGSLLVLLLCGYSLNINSFLGILILSGTAINISIILTAGLEAEFPVSRERLVSVCSGRLPPVAATVLSTVVSMVPIAVNTSGEGKLQSHTAVALLGGLIIGSISTLLVFPVLYDRAARLLRSRR